MVGTGETAWCDRLIMAVYMGAHEGFTNGCVVVVQHEDNYGQKNGDL